MTIRCWIHVYKDTTLGIVEADCHDDYDTAVDALNVSAYYVETITRDAQGNLVSIDMREDKEEAEREAEAEAASADRLRSSYYNHANLGIR